MPQPCLGRPGPAPSPGQAWALGQCLNGNEPLIYTGIVYSNIPRAKLDFVLCCALSPLCPRPDPNSQALSRGQERLPGQEPRGLETHTQG
ncbi:Sodium/Hydrogen Exchanger 1 [Manis pentadactyla]|nr:Sodium/Hydrogen Exchanger 1 [Manis pentadactyla]